jgi:hypothetical protein
MTTSHRALEYPRGPVKMDKAIIEKMIANQEKLEFTKTSATLTICTVPGKSILDMVVVENSAAFNGSVMLGNASDDDAYIPAASFPIAEGMNDPILLGIPITTATAVKVKTSGNTTGAGTIWLFWRPLK